MDNTQALPLLALRDIVMFPGIIAPIFIARSKSLKALDESKKIGDGQYILLATQRNQEDSDPQGEDLYNIGAIGKIIQIVQISNANAKILIEAVERVEIFNIKSDECLSANFKISHDKNEKSLNNAGELIDRAVSAFKDYIGINKKVNPEIVKIIQEERNASYVANILASHLPVKLTLKQTILEEQDVTKRIELLVKIINNEIGAAGTEATIQQMVKKQIEKTQRDYYLNEQMKAIQKELDGGEDKSDISDLEKKIKTLKLSEEAKEKAEGELKKLKQMNQMSGESSVVRNYLETLLAMPWGKFDKPKIDTRKAQVLLDQDHFGLEKVKERIIEYIAVLQRSDTIKSPIICFIGPPGVGKTSLVKSIANALGRKYAKISLGGVRDEAEIRGHRRTYLGSMPGRIISAIKKAKVSNPVILLDEIDKMGMDFKGDPTSALLELLDPEQNKLFVDHYLDVAFDVSKVIFIATANSYNLPRPLLDRLEIINVSGYIEKEKLQIAKDYLIPKQLEMHNLKQAELEITDDATMEIIRYYTKESGVRSLERDIAALCRKSLKRLLEDKELKSIRISPTELKEYLGVKKYRVGLAEIEDQIGATTGLAYTEVGGDLLTIEAVSFPGKGEVKTTGKLGDVMKESAQAAYSCFRVRADTLGLKYENYKDLDIHLHVPEGAIPKDGPSAGIALFTTIVSVMTGTPVKRNVAMTGEITLRGKVLPIGGLKEKLLAASRGGITTVLIPVDNVKDLEDIPQNIKDTLEILPVTNIDEVLNSALARVV
jgi:ATP-dependent Lon protease